MYLVGIKTSRRYQFLHFGDRNLSGHRHQRVYELGPEAFRALADRVTTKSSVFIVRARGELESGAYQAVEAWVRREGDRARVIRWREAPRWPGWDTWGWESRDVAASGGSTAAPGN